MTRQFLAQIFKILKKLLLRLAHGSARLFLSLLSLFRRFAVRPSKLGDRHSRFSTGALRDTVTGEDVPIFSSRFPSGQLSLEVVEDPPSPSDVPYSRTHARSLRGGTDMPSPEAATSTKAYPSAAEPYRLSVSSLHSSQQGGESHPTPPSPRIPYDQKGKGVDPVERGGKESSVDNKTSPRHPLQASGSPHPSPLLGIHGLVPISQRAPSVNSSVRSLTRSIDGSESRLADYRTHTGAVRSRPISARSSFADLRHRSPHTVPIPSDGPVLAAPSGLAIHPDIQCVASPGGDEGQQGTDVVTIYDGPPISEMVPDGIDGIKRYGRCIPRETGVSNTTVPAMTVTFPVHDEAIPPGWITVVHPEGSRYFVNIENRTLTENNICDDEIYQDVEYYMQFLRQELVSDAKREEAQLAMTQVDLVLEIKKIEKAPDDIICGYYFANHRDRCLFWLDEFDAEDVLSDCEGIKTISHKALAIQAQYWKHWDYFPSLCPIAQKLVDEVENMLVHAKCDHLTSKQSCAAYNANELRDYLSVVKRIKVPPPYRKMEQCHAAIVIGRIMNTFSHNAFINFHGEDCARLNFEQTVHGWVYKPSTWMVVFAYTLFLEPATQVQELHKIFADKIARTSRWNAFSSNLKRQLQESNILATVLLNANVGFLGMNKGGRSFIQIASYLSLVTSLGSIVLGLFFVSQDRISAQSTADEAAKFLSKHHDERYGLESLAVIYSLPKALLMWGMVFFFAAFSMYWCTSGDITSRVVVGAVTLVVFTTIAISMVRTKEGDGWWPMNLKRAVEDSEMESVQSDDDEPGINMASMGTPVGPMQATAAADNPMRGPSPTISRYPPQMSSVSLHSSHRLNDGNSKLHSPHLRPRPSFLSGVGSLQQIREDTQTVSQYHPTAEARSEPDRDSPRVHFMTSSSVDEQLHSGSIPTDATIPSEHEKQTPVVPTDAGDPVSPDPLCLDEREVNYMGNMVEEPQELEVQRGESTTSLPGIFGRKATDDEFYHARPAAKWTLKDGHDIEER